MSFCFTTANNQTPVLHHFKMSESCGGEESGQRNLSRIFAETRMAKDEYCRSKYCIGK